MIVYVQVHSPAVVKGYMFVVSAEALLFKHERERESEREVEREGESERDGGGLVGLA